MQNRPVVRLAIRLAPGIGFCRFAQNTMKPQESFLLPVNYRKSRFVCQEELDLARRLRETTNQLIKLLNQVQK